MYSRTWLWKFCSLIVTSSSSILHIANAKKATDSLHASSHNWQRQAQLRRLPSSTKTIAQSGSETVYNGREPLHKKRPKIKCVISVRQVSCAPWKQMVTCSWVIATVLSSWRYMCNSEVFKCVCEFVDVFKISTH